MGKSMAFKRVQKGEMIKLYSNDLSFTFEHDVFKEISVIENKRFDLILGKYNLFVDSYVINLLQDNYTCTLKYGFIIFDEPGLAFSGCSGEESQRSVIIYSVHYWDGVLNG